MDTTQWLITLGGAGLVAFVLWFFFGPRTAAAAHVGSGGVQEVDVDVRSSYVPDRIEAQAGRPIRIKFRRDDPNPCTDQVVFPDFGVVRDLPLGRVTTVELTPPAAGEYPFHCGMNMVRGALIAK
ncbi:MAG TPA: cupredoxin domain-containing protein [Gemmataceae bacterium]|nr:cupredoxin domain-containing protein [Gemmataceae bacterium]